MSKYTRCENGHYEIGYDSTLDLECPLCKAISENEELTEELEGIQETRDIYKAALSTLQWEVDYSIKELIDACEKADEYCCADVLNDLYDEISEYL